MNRKFYKKNISTMHEGALNYHVLINDLNIGGATVKTRSMMYSACDNCVGRAVDSFQ